VPGTEQHNPRPDVQPDRRVPPPRWVLVAAAVTLALLVAFAVLHLSGSPVHH
jgi:hypothetical protein